MKPTTRQRRGEPGRVRMALVKLLEKEGFILDASEIHAAQGRYRSDVREDIVRWDGHARRTDLPSGVGVSLTSWYTMSECVKRGIVVKADPSFHLWFWVSAKEPETAGPGHTVVCARCGKHSAAQPTYREAYSHALKDGWTHYGSYLCADCAKVGDALAELIDGEA